jgi:hypothetical protein
MIFDGLKISKVIRVSWVRLGLLNVESYIWKGVEHQSFSQTLCLLEFLLVSYTS